MRPGVKDVQGVEGLQAQEEKDLETVGTVRQASDW